MLKTLRTIALCLAGFVLLAFTVFVVNQTVQVVELAERLDPRFGLGVLWVLLVTYAVLLLTPVYLWLRLPPALAPAKSAEGPEFEQHLEASAQASGAQPAARGGAAREPGGRRARAGLALRGIGRADSGGCDAGLPDDGDLPERAARRAAGALGPHPPRLAAGAPLLPAADAARHDLPLRQCRRHGVHGRRARGHRCQRADPAGALGRPRQRRDRRAGPADRLDDPRQLGADRLGQRLPDAARRHGRSPATARRWSSRTGELCAARRALRRP